MKGRFSHKKHKNNLPQKRLIGRSQGIGVGLEMLTTEYTEDTEE